MANGLQVLQFAFPDGQVPDGYQEPEKALALIAGFDERYEALKTIFDSGYMDHDRIQDLGHLYKSHFHHASCSALRFFAGISQPNFSFTQTG
jgi:hypothetical protein